MCKRILLAAGLSALILMGALLPARAIPGPGSTATATRTFLPLVARADPPTPTPTPAPTSPPPTATPRPVCACHADLYNCVHFSTQAQAQACYRYCLDQGAGDIHRLDSDNDGIACEHLP